MTANSKNHIISLFSAARLILASNSMLSFEKDERLYRRDLARIQLPTSSRSACTLLILDDPFCVNNFDDFDDFSFLPNSLLGCFRVSAEVEFGASKLGAELRE